VAAGSGAVSIVSAVIAAGSAVTTFVLTRRAAINDRQRSADDVAVRYREPLLHAAFNLETRLYNIVRKHFLDAFLARGTPEEADYARLNTVYLIGQYLCWSEILRREAQFVDPVDRQRDRAVNQAMERVRSVMSDSFDHPDRTLRVFRGDQRAIGEVLLTTVDAAPGRTGPRWDCRGYAAFTTAIRDDDGFARWFQPLLADVNRLAAEPGQHTARLVDLQHALVDLINLIDPRGERVSAQLRTKL
jgi:hypothetical protein